MVPKEKERNLKLCVKTLSVVTWLFTIHLENIVAVTRSPQDVVCCL